MGLCTEQGWGSAGWVRPGPLSLLERPGLDADEV